MSAELLPLIPYPKNVERTEGVFRLTPRTRVFLPETTERPEYLAAARLIDVWERASGVRAILARPGRLPVEDAAPVRLEVRAPESIAEEKREGYTLTIGADGVKVTGNSPAGLFNGIQTLIQLAEKFGAALPGLRIEDWPDYRWRGFYFDITRGKVPTLATMKWVADYLAAHKINMLQLYVEHCFAFWFDPQIQQLPDALTPEEVLELAEYCRDRRIDFVPSLQSFGHMGGALGMPHTKHLADVELPASFAELDWFKRMAGATINVDDPEALKFLERMHDEFLPLFDSQFVNVCADETYDLGKGRTKELADRDGKASLYIRHIRWLNELCHKYGRRMMFWGDIVRQYPDQIPSVPKDAICMDWAYHRGADYDGCRQFGEAGLDFFVVPGTSGWVRIMNQVETASINIRRWAEAGKRHGAMGLLNTDWGDHGHFNLLGGSVYGMALGAAMSWNVGTPGEAEFDRVWNERTFGLDDGAAIASMRAQSEKQDEYLATWRLFYLPMEGEEFRKKLNESLAAGFRDNGRAGEEVFADYLRRATGERWIVEELQSMSRVNALLGEKFFLAQDLDGAAKLDKAGKEQLAARLMDFADRVEAAFAAYRPLWMARNKETDLELIEAKFVERAQEARDAARKLTA